MTLVVTPQETFLGIEEAAQALQCSADHLGELAAAGKVTGVKVGRAWVFLASDLVAFLRAKHKEGERCVSTPVVRTGMRTSVGSRASSELAELLGPSRSSRKSRQQSRHTNSPQHSSPSLTLLQPDR
jgi:excisionase family DNA binding protein